MKLEEAITDLECLAQSETAGIDEEEQVAIGLGIEALKAIKDVRISKFYPLIETLPGETKEN